VVGAYTKDQRNVLGDDVAEQLHFQSPCGHLSDVDVDVHKNDRSLCRSHRGVRRGRAGVHFQPTTTLGVGTVSRMSYFLPHLPSGWHVDEAIKSEEDRVVAIRFGHDWDSQCMVMDESLYSVAEKVQNFAVILCDITEVPDFNKVCNLPPL
jgi:hypothetical protein